MTNRPANTFLQHMVRRAFEAKTSTGKAELKRVWYQKGYAQGIADAYAERDKEIKEKGK